MVALSGMRLVQRIAPASIGVILLTGLYMMAVSWKARGWILAALAGLVLIALVGGLLTGVRMARVGPALGSASESLSPETASALRDPLLLTSLRVRLALTLGIAFLMTVKPSPLASAVVLALAAAVGWLAGLARRSRSPVSEALRRG
jgi:chromate transport protein ChrA